MLCVRTINAVRPSVRQSGGQAVERDDESTTVSRWRVDVLAHRTVKSLEIRLCHNASQQAGLYTRRQMTKLHYSWPQQLLAPSVGYTHDKPYVYIDYLSLPTNCIFPSLGASNRSKTCVFDLFQTNTLCTNVKSLETLNACYDDFLLTIF